MARIPHEIFAYWHQGADELPELVAMVLERWRRLNPGWRLTLLDAGDARRLLHDSPMVLDDQPIPTIADLLRARVLRDHGGVWVDATLYPVLPLDAWLPEVVDASGFFTFDGPRPDRPIVNWFLAAEAGSPVMARLYDEFDRYWSTPRRVVKTLGRWPGDPIAAVSPGTEADPAPYFWFHFLFARLLEVDEQFARAWEATPRITPRPCFTVWTAVKQDASLGHDRLHALAATAPVQKLTLTKAKYPVEALRDLEFTTAPLQPARRNWTPATARALAHTAPPQPAQPAQPAQPSATGPAKAPAPRRLRDRLSGLVRRSPAR